MSVRTDELGDAYQQCRERGGVADLSDRVKLRLTGTDRVRYLNGQVTCDVRRLAPGESIAGCILTAKGKLSADVMITATDTALYLDGDPALRETLPARMERYIIADDVTLEDVSDQLSLLHCFGGEAGDLLRVATRAVRFGIQGHDIFIETERAGTMLRELLQTRVSIPEPLQEVLRIEAGQPRWSHELNGNTLPPEAGLERTHIDYFKGCYIGQEVISRLKSVGHVNRRLVGVSASGGEVLVAGMQIFMEAEPMKILGTLTSACWSFALEKPIALGYLKRGSPTESLLARNPEQPGTAVPLRLQELPFTS